MRVGYPAAADYLLGGLWFLLFSMLLAGGTVSLLLHSLPCYMLILTILAVIFSIAVFVFPLNGLFCSYYRGIYGVLAGILSMEIFLIFYSVVC
jgi:hypothetical protein